MQSRVSSRCAGTGMMWIMQIVRGVLPCQGFMPLTTQCFRRPELRLFMLELEDGNEITLS